jgi:hypothetical protein
MKKMKNYFNSAIVILLSVLLFNSCKDGCEDTVCENGAYCVDGTCVCPEGFTGNNCQTPINSNCTVNPCQNGGTCNTNGTCNCPSGYTGAFCQNFNSNTITVTFYNDQSNVGVITVYLNNTTGTITSNISNPSCGQNGCANFYIQSGYYSWTASSTTGEFWNGYDYFSNSCTTYYLR